MLYQVFATIVNNKPANAKGAWHTSPNEAMDKAFLVLSVLRKSVPFVVIRRHNFKYRKCHVCNGTGDSGYFDCRLCNGTGELK